MRVKVKLRLLLGFSLIMFLTFILGVAAISSMSKIKDNAKEMNAVWTNGVRLSESINTSVAEMRGREYRHIVISNKEDKQKVKKDIDVDINQVEEYIKQYEGTIILDEDRKILEDVKKEWSQYKAYHDMVLDLSNKNMAKEAESLMVGDGLTQYQALSKACEDLSQYNSNMSTKSLNQIMSIYNNCRYIVIVILIMVIMLAILIAFMIGRNITGRIAIVSRALEKTASYDLAFDEKLMNDFRKHKTKDEIQDMGYVVVRMREELRGLAQTISKHSEGVEKDSKELSGIVSDNAQVIEGIAKAVDDMAQGATELAQNTQTSSEKLDELSKELEVIGNESQEMKKYIDESNKAKNRGIEVVNNLKSTIIENNEVAEKVGMKVSELGAKSEKISMITQTIRGITSQVNLLSLNASIEAARAGEAGKGFAVVAAEIKKLADDTAKSTVEIENIVHEFKEIILGTNKEMIVAKEVINATSRMSKETDIAFSSIDTAVSSIIEKIDMLVDGINRINKNKQETTMAIEDISAVSEESASTTEEISSSIQEQAASIEQIANSAENLYSIANELKSVVSRFKL